MIDRLNAALAGRYRVEELVGQGGMASVYRAVDLRHERTVAIKVMNPDFAATVGRDRFLREIRVTAGLSHSHILPLFDSGDLDGVLFYVMPFIEGVSLRQRLEAQPRLPLDEVRKIARETAEALSYAHGRGIVHRDIKPENIMLAGFAPGTSSWQTLVADFGIAVPTQSLGDQLTSTGMAVGSPLYMSPEQMVGERVDHRSDIWALGCVVFEMLEGRSPRGVPSFRTANLPASVTRAVLRALAADPEERQADAREFAAALDGRDSARRIPGRRVWYLAAALAAGVLIATTWPTWRPVRGGPQLTHDTLALSLYRQARVTQQTRTASGIALAFSQYAAAIARDSGFALAWSGLARTAQMAVLRGYPVSGYSSDSLMAIAVAASQRAVTLDPGASEVWVARARVLESIEPTSRTGVLNDLNRAIAVDPDNGEAWFLLGRAREELLDSAGAREAYERAVQLAPNLVELLSFVALHYLWSGNPAAGVPWADSAVVIEPTSNLARDAAIQLAIELRDWRAAERHLIAIQQMARGTDATIALGYAARLAALQGEADSARRLIQAGAALADSARLTKHEAAYLAAGFAAVGDTARALRWLAAFSPRRDVHYQLHLHRDPGLAWLHDPRFRRLLE